MRQEAVYAVTEAMSSAIIVLPSTIRPSFTINNACESGIADSFKFSSGLVSHAAGRNQIASLKQVMSSLQIREG